MAGVSTKEIKNRIRSMESTRQITKAMEMVAASKLRRAQAQVLSSRPYFEILYSTIADIASSNRDFSSPYLQERPVKKALYIVIAGDRGLAGGYNSNILKLVQSEIAGKDAVVLPIGKKALDYFRSKQIPTFTEHYAEAAELTVGDCFSVSKQVSKAFLAGEFDQIVVAYTNFVSVLAQTPAAMQLLPLKKPEKKESTNQGAPTMIPIFMVSRATAKRFSPRSFPSIWAALSTVRCAKAAPPSRLPAGLPWIPRPRTPTI